MSPRTHDGAQVVITTEQFRRGQAAAWEDYDRDPDSAPNHEILARIHPEFAAGYLDEWEHFVAAARARAHSHDGDE